MQHIILETNKKFAGLQHCLGSLIQYSDYGGMLPSFSDIH